MSWASVPKLVFDYEKAKRQETDQIGEFIIKSEENLAKDVKDYKDSLEAQFLQDVEEEVTEEALAQHEARSKLESTAISTPAERYQKYTFGDGDGKAKVFILAGILLTLIGG